MSAIELAREAAAGADAADLRTRSYARFVMGVAYRDMGRLEEAAEIRHSSSLALANAFLGYAHLLRGDLPSAIPVLERGLAIAEEHDVIHGVCANSVMASAELGHVVVIGERHLRGSLRRTSITTIGRGHIHPRLKTHPSLVLCGGRARAGWWRCRASVDCITNTAARRRDPVGRIGRRQWTRS